MTNKLKYFIGNWKMFGDFSSLKIINKINQFSVKFSKKFKKNRIILCVPNTLINYFATKLKSNHILIGGQNCHYNKFYGPFTGGVSAFMLKKAGAKYVILGHSESRSEGDTNLIIKKKIESALNNNLKVIFCIGETYKEKSKGKTLSTLKKQIKYCSAKKNKLNRILIAYEPVWSIGTGKIPDKHELIKTFKFIKLEIKKRFKTKKTPPLLYGGSVNERNISIFTTIPYIEGFLIGGASQSSKKFIDIIKNYYK